MAKTLAAPAVQLDLFGEAAVVAPASAPPAPAPPPARVVAPATASSDAPYGTVVKTCGTCNGKGMWKSRMMRDPAPCPDCKGVGTRTIAVKPPCPPEAVAHARTEYDHRAQNAMLEFSREARRRGYDHRCTSAEGRFCQTETARFANELLRGIASDRPKLTEERWKEALAALVHQAGQEAVTA